MEKKRERRTKQKLALTGVSRRARARVVVESVSACSAVLTRVRVTLVHLTLAVHTFVAGCTLARVPGNATATAASY